MIFTLRKYYIAYQARIISALILTAILSVSAGLTIVKSAYADSISFTPIMTNEVLAKNQQTRLPPNIANAVLRDLARKQGISTQDIKIVDYRQQTWNNGCLELPQPNELCTQALVPGWRVVVSNNKQSWIYHTNANGRSLRLVSANTPTNPSTNIPESQYCSVKEKEGVRS